MQGQVEVQDQDKEVTIADQYVLIRSRYGTALWMSAIFAPSTVETPIRFLESLAAWAGIKDDISTLSEFYP